MERLHPSPRLSDGTVHAHQKAQASAHDGSPKPLHTPTMDHRQRPESNRHTEVVASVRYQYATSSTPSLRLSRHGSDPSFIAAFAVGSLARFLCPGNIRYFLELPEPKLSALTPYQRGCCIPGIAVGCLIPHVLYCLKPPPFREEAKSGGLLHGCRSYRRVTSR